MDNKIRAEPAAQQWKRVVIIRSAPVSQIAEMLSRPEFKRLPSERLTVLAQKDMEMDDLSSVFGKAQIIRIPAGPFRFSKIPFSAWRRLFALRPDIFVIPYNNTARIGYAMIELFALLICKNNTVGVMADGERFHITTSYFLARCLKNLRSRIMAPRVGDPVTWARIFLFPITALVTNLFRLLQALWSCRVLLGAGRREYMHFNVHSGINHLVYWTMALNLSRHGRNGVSPHIGLGDYQMKRWFHLSLAPLYPYWNNAPVTLLAGMFGWLVSHLVWMGQVDSGWVLAVMGLALISSLFYHNLFEAQNYNVLGWLFVPTALYATSNGDWFLASLMWLAASQFSFTVGFIAVILLSVLAAVSIDPAPALAIAPAALNLLRYCAPLITGGGAKKTMIRIAKAIGIVDGGIKYKRIYKTEFSIDRIFYLPLNLQFLITATLISGTISPMLAMGNLIYFVNTHYKRFADSQTMRMLLLSLATAQVIQTPSLLLLASYWLAVSPPPFVLGWVSKGDLLDIIPRRQPFYVKRILDVMRRFLDPVEPGEKILAVYDDPENRYEHIFAGYRLSLELPFYVASEKHIHLMPDWWAIFDVNNYDSPDLFWGRDVESVKRNASALGACYAMIYQESGEPLDEKWTANGFAPLGRFDWADFLEDFGELPYSGPPFTWWLLRTPTDKKTCVTIMRLAEARK